ncbi:MAG: [Clostridia bacterium]|nr:[FeFe] hydrogenase H-cluster radical SAM maturase HydE [Clostridia bacterium]
MRHLIDRLFQGERLTRAEFQDLVLCEDQEMLELLFRRAKERTEEVFGNHVYIRGLIEISSYCKQDCFYCGLRCSNHKAQRYRLSPNEIIATCEKGYEMGFRTFVLQGGEDDYYTDDAICELIREICLSCPGSAVTLSLGEKGKRAYEAFRKAGASRYLLRHETATAEHFSRLHPPSQRLQSRMEALATLKDLGFQVGAGFMVGSPFQTAENLAEDLYFLQEFRPHMVGIGPFIPHQDTPFGKYPAGDSGQTVKMIAITRGILPGALIPATTALATLSKDARGRALQAGANVVMPNLSPEAVRVKYNLYNNKLSTGTESAQMLAALREELEGYGRKMDLSRGDSPLWKA